MRFSISFVFAAVLLACCMPLAAYAVHPAAGCVTRDVDVNYGSAGYSYPAHWSHADLTFGSSYPAVNELNPAERYMLAGTLDSNLPDTRPLNPWISEVTSACLDYASRYAKLPDTLNPVLFGAGSQYTAGLELNPLTGKPASINSKEFSAGNLYVRPLTRGEMLYFASKNEQLKADWFGIEGSPNPAELDGPVLYVRAYGSKGVIYEDLAYRTKSLDSDIATVLAIFNSGESASDRQAMQAVETAVKGKAESKNPVKPCRTG